MNPDDTFKKYDVIHFRNGYNPYSYYMIVELKEIKIFKEELLVQVRELFSIGIGENIRNW